MLGDGARVASALEDQREPELDEQDRSRWNRTLIYEGRLLLVRVAVYQTPGSSCDVMDEVMGVGLGVQCPLFAGIVVRALTGATH